MAKRYFYKNNKMYSLNISHKCNKNLLYNINNQNYSLKYLEQY